MAHARAGVAGAVESGNLVGRGVDALGEGGALDVLARAGTLPAVPRVAGPLLLPGCD